MDTDAIYSAIASRIVSSKRGDHVEAEFYQDEIKRLLNEADEEHKSLLATNEKLVDEVAELKAAYESQFKELHELKTKLTEKASLLRGCYARINGLEKALKWAVDYSSAAPAGEMEQLREWANVARAALEKKHEAAT